MTKNRHQIYQTLAISVVFAIGISTSHAEQKPQIGKRQLEAAAVLALGCADQAGAMSTKGAMYTPEVFRMYGNCEKSKDLQNIRALASSVRFGENPSVCSLIKNFTDRNVRACFYLSATSIGETYGVTRKDFNDSRSWKSVVNKANSRLKFFVSDHYNFTSLEAYEEAIAGNFSSAEDYTAATAGGFVTAGEYANAKSGGFSDKKTFDLATAAGFKSASDYSAATAGGFANAGEYAKYKSGGFSNKKTFDLAAAAGFKSASDYSAATAGGFGSAGEYAKAKSGGFSDKNTFDLATTAGFKSASDYSAANSGGFASAGEYAKAKSGGFSDNRIDFWWRKKHGYNCYIQK